MTFNQSHHRSLFLMMVVLLLVLTACERPFQEDAADIQVPSVNQPAAGEDLFQTESGVETPAAGEDNTGTPDIEPVEGSTTETDAAPTEDPAAAEQESQDNTPALETNEAGDRIYIVSSGDTVGRIAVLYGVTVEDIAAANPSLSNVNVLDVGQELVIPEPGFAASGQAAAPADEEESDAEEPAPAAGSTEEQIHVVSAGDTIYSIGLIYGFTVEELQEYNNLPNPDVLKIGDEIRIPPASTGE